MQQHSIGTLDGIDTLQRLKHLSKRSRSQGSTEKGQGYLRSNSESDRSSNPTTTPGVPVKDKNVLWDLLNNSMVSDHTGKMHAVGEIPAPLAVRKIGVLIETKKYEECSVLIKKMNYKTLKEVLQDLQVQALLLSIPDSLAVLEVLFSLTYENEADNFPHDVLSPDEVVRHIVKYFAKSGGHFNGAPLQRQGSRTSQTSTASMHYEYTINNCRTIITIISKVCPDLRHKLSTRKNNFDEIVLNLAKHGLVETFGNEFMNLHEALNIEFNRTVGQYKSAIHKLEELSLTQRKIRPSSVTDGCVPKEVSHERLLKFTLSEVETRLIKNKTLLNAVEPATSNVHLSGLLSSLETRINNDKETLFCYSELRKEMKDITSDAIVSHIFQKYSQAYGKALDIISEGSNVGKDCTDNVFVVQDVADGLTVTGGLSEGSSNSRRNKRDSRSVPESLEATNRHSLNNSTPDIRSSQTNGSSTSGHPVPVNMTSNPTYVTNGAPVNMKEVQGLKNEVRQLKRELVRMRELIGQYEEREQALKDRLSEQARRQIDKSERFEDITMGTNRPTQLIQCYGYLYTQTRVDALDSLDSLPELADSQVNRLKGKLIFSVVVLSFRCAQSHYKRLQTEASKLLYLSSTNQIQNDPIVKEMQDTIELYLRKTVDRFDTQALVKEVCSQIYSTLYDYPTLKTCEPLRHYIEECINLAWKFAVQNPPVTIEFDSADFDSSKHMRFHTSNPDSVDIQAYIWPCLVETQTGHCLHKGVVIT